MKIAVVGSRDFNDYQRLSRELKDLEIDVILSGGASGADKLAKRYAEESRIDFEEWLPRHQVDKDTPYNPKWYHVRDEEMINEADTVVAFWNGISKGTKNVIDYAQREGKLLKVVRFGGMANRTCR